MNDASSFEEHRPFLHGLAYRMLGSVADADDIVQDTFLRWTGAGQPVLDEPRAWLARTCTRLCIDRLRRVQRERDSYPGEWLPEPLVEDSRAEMDETLSMALLVTIERLNPKERAAFLLHDVFHYRFDEAADVLGLTADHCRQLARRARERLADEAPRRSADRATLERLTDSFFTAIRDGDESALRDVLAADVVLRADGGGVRPAAPKPILGARKVARFLVAVARPKGVPIEASLERRTFNGAPGVLVIVDGEVVSAYQLDVEDDRVRGVYVVRNPAKLATFR